MPEAISGRIAKGLRLCAAAAAFWLGFGPAQAERVALVVGNGDYTVAPDLKNPVGDATAVAAGLNDLGFKVTLLTDSGTAAFQKDLDSFVAKAEGAESVVFYYAGHAFQLSGVNYLVPVDAALDSRERLTAETWSLDAVIARLQSRNRQTLIFLDACRNDPLPQGVRGSGMASDGLARVQAGVGTFVAFATAPGAVSADGVAGADHSPFATALLKHLPEKGKSVSDMMIEVRNDVENATLRKQVPWDQSSLREQFYFVPPDAAAKQELSEADYELLAQLAPEDREQFLALLAKSGFDEGSLKLAEEEIALAEANLEQVAEETTILDSPAVDTPAPAAAEVAEGGSEDLGKDAGKTAPAPDALVSLEDLQVADESVAIGDAPLPDDTAIAALGPALKPEETDGKATIRLAALDWDSRKIDLGGPARLQGREVTADTPEGRDLLAAIDPRLLDQSTALPADLAKAVQGELLRVGCYRMAVDGNWGKGSRTALTSYYLAKHVVPTSLEPSADLFTTLSGETKVVCEARVASSAVKTGKRAQVETAPVAKASVKSNVKTGKKQETAKTRITKGTIGITGSF